MTYVELFQAIAGDNNDEIDLLDERGCPTDPIIFPGLTQLPNSRDLQGNFEAFKFSDTSVVRLDYSILNQKKYPFTTYFTFIN